MITNKRSQELLMLATTGKKLNKDATEEEKKFYEECKHDYKVMHETAKKHGIKNPILEIPMEIDFWWTNSMVQMLQEKWQNY
mgnify:CR=1 FL=1